MEIYKKILRYISVMLVLVIILTSCNFSKDEDVLENSASDIDSVAQDNALGRFVQNDITPLEIENSHIINFSKGENEQSLLTVYDEDSKEPKAFLYQDSIWEEQENEQVVNFLRENTYSETKAIHDFEGNWWLFLKDIEFFDKVIRISRDGSFLELEIPEVFYLDKILLNTEGVLYIRDSANSEHFFIDTKSGGLIENKIPKDVTAIGMCNDRITTIDFFQTNIVVYNFKTGDIIDSYEIPTNIPLDTFTDSIFINEDKFVCLTSSGIHKMILGDDMLQNVIDDKSFAFANPNNPNPIEWSILENIEEDTYLMAIELGESLKLYEYSYDNSVTSYKSDSLSIWALESDVDIDNSVALFSQKHPECKVNIEYAIEYSDDNEEAIPESYDDIIRNLNARLLSGDAPDVLFLDGLPIETYIKRGILSNLNIPINPLEYYENIMNSYNINEEIYAYPTSFYFFLFASDGTIGEISTHNTMENIAKLYQDPKAIEISHQDSLLNPFYADYSHKIFPDYKTVNEEALKEFLTQTQIMINSSKKNRSISGSFRFGDSDSIVTTIYSPLDAGNLFLTQKNVEIVPLLDGTYRNKNIVSIPVDAKNKKKAEEFIYMMLEEESNQIKNSISFGFSVKKEVNWTQINKDLQLEKTNDSDSNIEYNLERYEDFNEIDWDGLIGNLQYSSSQDYVSQEIVYEEAKLLFEGQLSVDEAASKIMGKLNILFSERN